jgi:hypothetical protein
VIAAAAVDLSDISISFSSILVIAAVALLAPILVNLAPKLRLPAVALEIVIGVIVGPSGLGWLEIDLPVIVLSLFGLAFLLFLAGLEIDPQRLRGRLKTISLAFVVSLALAAVCAFGFQPIETIRNPFFVAIMLASTSLGLVVPVIRDAGESETEFGQTVLAASSLAEFGTILLVSIFFSASSSGSPGSGAKIVLLIGFGALVVALGWVSRIVLTGALWQVVVGTTIVGMGTGIGYATMPALINRNTPPSEISAANGLNSLARSFGSTLASAIGGGLLTASTVVVAGIELPSLGAYRALFIACASSAVLAAVAALFIPHREHPHD